MDDHSRIAQVSKVVSEKLGLYFPANRFKDLSSALHLAARELGFEEDGSAFISLLIDQKLTSNQLDILAEQLTIGETYFFREKKTLSAFREMIIPSLVKEREHTSRSIRLWSAGCCSGEEPYTLAMILSEIIPDIVSWNITILATDINRRFLHKATKGRYTPWSFRETSIETKNSFFTPVGKEFEISREIREMVSFQQLNLVEDLFPAERNNTCSMDVIFCRNVLMYFSPETARAVVGKFYHSLAEEGWLITSQVELSDELFHLLDKVNYKNSFLYRKRNTPDDLQKRSQSAEKKRSEISSSPARKHLSVHPKRPVQITNPATVIQSQKKAADQEANLLEKARYFANQGDFRNASQWLERYIATNRSNPEAYYLSGVILFEQGDLQKAEQQMKKVLYLDPGHLLAHFQLVTICLRSGREKHAMKHKHNVADLLQNFQDEDSLPGSGGMTAGHLKDLLKAINTKEPDG